jgi:hypothetical protein
LCAFLISPILPTFQAHRRFLDYIIRTILYNLWQVFSLHKILYSEYISSVLGQNIFTTTFYLENCYLHSSVKIRDYILRPYGTSGNVIIYSDFQNLG